MLGPLGGDFFDSHCRSVTENVVMVWFSFGFGFVVFVTRCQQICTVMQA